MRIEAITLHHIDMPLVAPFETSFGRETHRPCILVEMRADGRTGWGECVAGAGPWYAYETIGTAWHIIGEFLAPMLIDQDIDSPECHC
jgi:O-succinylbenzoate synthase